MSSNIIKKCIDELAKPEPRLDYLRGLLEALDDSSRPTFTVASSTYVPSPVYPVTPPVGDMPPRPRSIPALENAALIAKLKGGATVEEVPIPLNATPKETT